MTPATTADLNHDFFELIASIIGMLLSLLTIITCCQGRQSITAWIVRHYQAFQQIQHILRNVTPDLPFHDIPPSARSTFQPQEFPVPETGHSSPNLGSSQEEERHGYPPRRPDSRNQNASLAGFWNLWTTTVPQVTQEVTDNLPAASSNTTTASRTPGIGDHARDSCDASRMASRARTSSDPPHDSLYEPTEQGSDSSQSVSRLGIEDPHRRTIHPDYANVEIAISAAGDPYRHLHVGSQPKHYMI
ncbi:uncharacterized protein BT62DRAFT_1004585 [Guyanagaster necrorhizus]|uniref:Uncharacterized protein n=1 Tax=Guyanagaster necrorhizus TaxID=856835 RepID=A0A9P7VW68_9AGAR|nr:uncharacterized protein BT62DRAFT_1004585 [Guyanagaster necrorhizus MCA 3950]KAG7447820.1 hypothetical protein BT62DRAFT_1004585 [Guyanagaster necrorhizus MCA 3950]